MWRVQRHRLLIAVSSVVAASALSAGPALAAGEAQPATEAQPGGERGVPIEVASAPERKIASGQYKLGVDLYKAKKFDKALKLLRNSMDRVSSPNTRLMIANTLVELGEHLEAYEQLRIVIAEAEPLSRGADRYKATIEAARATMAELDKKLARVELQPAAELVVNGEPVPPSKWSEPMMLYPGQATFELKLSNGQVASSKVELSAGQAQQIELRMPQPEQAKPATVIVEKPPDPAANEVTEANEVSGANLADNRAGISYNALGWTGAGVAAAGAIGFTVFGLMTNSQSQQLEDECTGTRCPTSLRSVAERGRTYRTIANTSLIVGVVGLVSSTIFFLSDSATAGTERPSAGNTRKPTQSAGFEATTALVVGPGSVGVRGQF